MSQFATAAPASDVPVKGDHASVPQVDVCVVTFLPSPYQVELFNQIAADGEVSIRVIYLRKQDRRHPWAPVELKHEHLFIELNFDVLGTAMCWCREAALTVFNYYTHWFALPALYARHFSRRPWVFWGERPGFLRLGIPGQWARKLSLRPLAHSAAPIWAVGRAGIAGYQNDWGQEKTYVNLPYYSDLSRFSFPARPDKKPSITLLYSGILNFRKGVLELAEAFTHVASECPELHLIILGSGPLESRMRDILLPVSDQVTWVGFRQWSTLPEYYAMADVLFLPTSYDGWAMVVPEALAAGLPVLTTRASGAALDMVQDGVNGWLLPTNAVPVLIRGLEEVVRLTPDRIREMSAAAKMSVQDHTLAQGALCFARAAQQALEMFHCQIDPPPSSRQTAELSQVRPHLLITGTYAPDGLRSMHRYVRLVEEAATGFAGRVSRVDPPVVAGRMSWLPAPLLKTLALLDKYLLFPFLLRWKITRTSSPHQPVIHVTDQGMGLVIPWLADFPLVVTCHDLIAIRSAIGELGSHRPWWRSWFQRLIRLSLRLDCVVVCVSHKTLADCRRLLGHNHQYLVVLNPLDPKFNEDNISVAAPPLPDSFLLHVGNSLWYKNRQTVVNIYAILRRMMTTPPELVMMGDPPTYQETQLVVSLSLQDHVTWMSRPRDSWIKNGYDRATALIFPSLEEGFGWPVLEAMSRGCPVFTSCLPPLTEVGGDAVDYINPDSPEEAAATIKSCLDQGTVWRSDRALRGRQRAAMFNMAEFSASMQQAYEIALAGISEKPLASLEF